MRLFLANKLYSSWSMRPWLLMKQLGETTGLEFEETVIPLREPDTKERILAVSPSGKLPCLHRDDGAVVWDSMAIISWLSDVYPDAGIWPADINARGHAKAICLEMHSGFQALRQACPMNFGKRFKKREFSADVMADVARISEIWADTRQRFGSSSFLFENRFTAADAVYAPVVSRLVHYQIEPDNDEARQYMQDVQAYPFYRQWVKEALQESWRIPAYEEGHEPEVEYRDYDVVTGAFAKK